MEPSRNNFRLPLSVISQRDVTRLIRELESFDDFLQQAKIRKSQDAKLPNPSAVLDELCHSDNLNLLHEDDRKRLKQALEAIKNQAPLVHISFAAEPPANMMGKIVTWLRQEIHPFALVTIGLQPGIGAGCVVRTPSKYFDFSLRAYMDQQRPLLINQLTGGNPSKP